MTKTILEKNVEQAVTSLLSPRKMHITGPRIAKQNLGQDSIEVTVREPAMARKQQANLVVKDRSMTDAGAVARKQPTGSTLSTQIPDRFKTQVLKGKLKL